MTKTFMNTTGSRFLCCGALANARTTTGVTKSDGVEQTVGGVAKSSKERG